MLGEEALYESFIECDAISSSSRICDGRAYRSLGSNAHAFSTIFANCSFAFTGAGIRAPLILCASAFSRSLCVIEAG